MSMPRPSTAPPLRDRLLSNSTDPVQSSIRRDSAKGWGRSSPGSNLGTTPLKIAKRDTKPPFPLVSRRSSSSYKHVRNSNLVSKSPFKTQPSTPSRPLTSTLGDPSSVPPNTRRVSGEKRPRPDSMHEQAENERPFAFKRERRQSRVYQELFETEPVTKSPFKRVVSAEEEEPPPLPPKLPLSLDSVDSPPVPPSPQHSAPPSRPITPSRSSLVSKRLHGPRTADQSSLDGTRQRRKTVTFDERCDVLEFDRDEEEDENPFLSSDEDDYGEPERQEEFGTQHLYDHFNTVAGDGVDEFSVENDDTNLVVPDITGDMMQPGSLPGLGLPSTPSRPSSLLVDMDIEDDVPYGRSHHAERARRRASVSSPSMTGHISESIHTIHPSPSMPPRTAESSMDLSSGPDFSLHMSTHVEGVQPARQRDEADEDASTVSTADHTVSRAKDDMAEMSFTSFEDPMDPANLSIGQSEVSLSNLDLEAELQMALGPQTEDKDCIPKLSSLIPCNPPFSTSTPPRTPPRSLATSGSSHVSADEATAPQNGPPYSPSQLRASPLHTSVSSAASCPSSPPVMARSSSPTTVNVRPRSDSPLNLTAILHGSPATRSASLSVRTGSSLHEIASSQESQSDHVPRTRISREDVQMRLMQKRSAECSLGSPAPGSPVPISEPPVSGEVGENPLDEQSTTVPHRYESDSENEQHMDITSGVINISAEFATIQTAEKCPLNAAATIVNGDQDVKNFGEDPTDDAILSVIASDNSPPTKLSLLDPLRSRPAPGYRESKSGMLETSLELSGGLGMGLRDSTGSIQLGEMRSALDRLMDDVRGSSGPSARKPNTCSQISAELITECKTGQLSADTSSNIGDDSMQTETDMDISMENLRSAPIAVPVGTTAIPMQRAATDSVVYTGPSFRTPVPTSPTKDAIRTREQLILEKRRQARRRDEEEISYYTPPRPTSMPPSSGRPSRRRSRSTGDAGALTKSDLLLDIGISDTEEEHLADSISKELRRLDPEHREEKYRIREHEAIFASADAEQVSHTSFAGDVNGGRAWKAVRRPSDMNEYAKQIKEYRSQEKPGKAHGKVFVRVLGVKGLKFPIPQQPTALTCTLNNGIHFVTTPETRLSPETRIDQEFELIEHNKLEFTLTLKIRRDPHIVAQFKTLIPPPPAPQPVAPPPPKHKGGMFGFLSSSPKKPVARATPPPPPPPPHKLPDNLARYLKQDGTLARALISFKDIAARCDTRLLEVKYPLIGQRSEPSGNAKTMELGEIVLQIFRLPSVPGVLSSQLPLSLDECLRGLRHVAWHKVTYFEGTLTQNGGDCTTWRRRMFRIIGANLIAFNDVTKKATATINLQKAVAVEDTQDARSAALNPDGRYRDDFDSLIAVERSFRLVFSSDQEILFFADSDEEKAKWLEVLRALVGHIPPNPLWAEFVWQRQQEMAGQAQSNSSMS